MDYPPRVEWDFLRQVLVAMGFSASFVQLVDMSHVNLHGAFKINGHVGGHFQFSNALLQGAPEAPIMYLLVIQTFVSLLQMAPRSHLQGIAVPCAHGRPGEMASLRVMAFADDLVAYLRRGRELAAFGALFAVYAVCLLYTSPSPRDS